MDNFLLTNVGVDIIPLLLAIKRQPHLWTMDTYLRHYPQGPFGEVDSIMLRFPEKFEFSGPGAEEKLARYKENMLPGIDLHESVDQPAYSQLPMARSLIMSLMHYVGGERLGRAFVNRITPGGHIFAHADTPVHAEYWDRFHIVLESNPAVEFRCGDETVNMKAGEVWWFQNAIEHEVWNRGTTERSHLVVDIRTGRGQ